MNRWRIGVRFIARLLPLSASFRAMNRWVHRAVIHCAAIAAERKFSRNEWRVNANVAPHGTSRARLDARRCRVRVGGTEWFE